MVFLLLFWHVLLRCLSQADAGELTLRQYPEPRLFDPGSHGKCKWGKDSHTYTCKLEEDVKAYRSIGLLVKQSDWEKHFANSTFVVKLEIDSITSSGKREQPVVASLSAGNISSDFKSSTMPLRANFMCVKPSDLWVSGIFRDSVRASISANLTFVRERASSINDRRKVAPTFSDTGSIAVFNITDDLIDSGGGRILFRVRSLKREAGSVRAFVFPLRANRCLGDTAPGQCFDVPSLVECLSAAPGSLTYDKRNAVNSISFQVHETGAVVVSWWSRPVLSSGRWFVLIEPGQDFVAHDFEVEVHIPQTTDWSIFSSSLFALLFPLLIVCTLGILNALSQKRFLLLAGEILSMGKSFRDMVSQKCWEVYLRDSYHGVVLVTASAFVLVAMQLSCWFWGVYIMTGNRDVCFYNYECYVPLIGDIPVNNIISHIPYFVCGTWIMFLLVHAEHLYNPPRAYRILHDNLRVTTSPYQVDAPNPNGEVNDDYDEVVSKLDKNEVVNVVEVLPQPIGGCIRARIGAPSKHVGWITVESYDFHPDHVFAERLGFNETLFIKSPCARVSNLENRLCPKWLTAEIKDERWYFKIVRKGKRWLLEDRDHGRSSDLTEHRGSEMAQILDTEHLYNPSRAYRILRDNLRVTTSPYQVNVPNPNDKVNDDYDEVVNVLDKDEVVNVVEVLPQPIGGCIRARIEAPSKHVGWITVESYDFHPHHVFAERLGCNETLFIESASARDSNSEIRLCPKVVWLTAEIKDERWYFKIVREDKRWHLGERDDGRSSDITEHPLVELAQFLEDNGVAHEGPSHKPPSHKPPNLSVFYALGLSIFMEGFGSLAYHICPMQFVFQFDTAMMFVIGFLSTVALLDAAPGYKVPLPFYVDTLPPMSSMLCVIVPLWLVSFLGTAFDYVLKDTSVMYYMYGAMVLMWALFNLWQARMLFPAEPHDVMRVSGVRDALGKYCHCLNIFRLTVFTLLLILLVWPDERRAVGGMSNVLLGISVLSMVLVSVRQIVRHYAHEISSGYERDGLAQALRDRKAKVICWKLGKKFTKFGFVASFLVVSSFALAVFSDKAVDINKSPADSRDQNQPCTLGIFDNHDIWHMLSATALALWVMILLEFRLRIRRYQLKHRFPSSCDGARSRSLR